MSAKAHPRRRVRRFLKLVQALAHDFLSHHVDQVPSILDRLVHPRPWLRHTVPLHRRRTLIGQLAELILKSRLEAVPVLAEAILERQPKRLSHVSHRYGSYSRVRDELKTRPVLRALPDCDGVRPTTVARSRQWP
jgi:hypothetical protein